MKSTAYAVLAIILATGILQTQAAKKQKKFCRGNDGIKYKPNQGYKEGCTQFMCVKKGKKIKMTSKPIPNCGNLKLANEIPYLLIGPKWMPICGHYFWDNNIGADIFCQNLGYSHGGVVEKERGLYNEDAYFVGRCDSRSITDLINGCTKEVLEDSSSCQKGSLVSIKVKCRGPEDNENVTVLQMNVDSLNATVETFQATVETLQATLQALLSVVTKQGTCMSDFMSSDCPATTPGKISLVDRISSNTHGISSNKGEINVNKAGINTTKADVSSNKNNINVNKAGIDTTKADVSSNKAGINSNKDNINVNKAGIDVNKADVSSNRDGIISNTATYSSIQAATTNLETCLGDVNSVKCPSSKDGKTSVSDAIMKNKDDVQLHHTGKTGGNNVVTGGNNGGARLATSETIGPAGVCSQGIPPLPVALESINSVFIDENLMTCGGYDGKDTQDACYLLKDYKSQWIEGPSMKIPRRHYSLTKVGEEVFAVGGVGENHVRVNSMEKYVGGEWTLLPQTLSDGYRIQHCTVYLKSLHSLVVIGGSPVGNKVQSFNISSGQWTDLAPLPLALYYHRCIVLDETIYVTGGQANNKAQKKVYKYKGEQWETSGELEEARYRHSIGMVDGKVMVVEGHGENGVLTSVETMDHNGNWKKEVWNIADGRNAMAMAEVPSESFPSPCL